MGVSVGHGPAQGVGVAALTVMSPSIKMAGGWIVFASGSVRIALLRVSVLVPGAMPLNVMKNKSPLPVTPGGGTAPRVTQETVSCPFAGAC